jgi:hypothetical protein
MKISNEVYNCLINQAIVMKHELEQSCDTIASKVVEEYFLGIRFSHFFISIKCAIALIIKGICDVI